MKCFVGITKGTLGANDPQPDHAKVPSGGTSEQAASPADVDLKPAVELVPPDADHLTSWENPVDLQMNFERQLKDTKKKALLMERDIIELTDSISVDQATCLSQDIDSPELAKASILNAQLKVYKSLTEVIVAQDGKLKLDETTDEAAQKQFWQQACSLLKLMGDTFETSRNMPTKVFVDVWKEFSTNITNACATCFCGGAILGTGVSLTVAFTSFQGVMGLLFHLFSVPLVALGFGAAGALIGLLVAAAVVGIISVLRSREENLRVDQQRLLELMEQLKTEEVTPEALVELRDYFDKVFKKPILEPLQIDTCIVCLESFEPEDTKEHSALHAVRAPLCNGRHFLHFECYNAWTQQTHDLRCTVCRQ